MSDAFFYKDGELHKWIYTPYITRNGKRVYPKNAKLFKFAVKVSE